MNQDGEEEENIELQTENLITQSTRTQRNLEGLFSDWIVNAKAANKITAQLRQDLASEKASNESLRQQVDKTTHDLAKAENAREEIVNAKDGLTLEHDRVLEMAKEMLPVIKMACDKNKELSKEIVEALAAVDIYKISLTGANERIEALEAELAAARALARHSKEETNASLIARAAEVSASPNDAVELSHLKDSLQRLQTKYDSLKTRKEHASKKFYESFVEWADFKAWWNEFRKFPGVSSRVVAFNRKLNGMDHIKGKSRIQKVAKEADDDPSKLPSGDTQRLKPTTEPRPLDLEKAREDRLEVETQFEDRRKEVEETFGPIVMQEEDQAFPTEEQPPTEGIAKEPVVPPLNSAQDDDDPDKTQQTTPGRSPRPRFRFDLSTLDLPPVELFSQPKRVHPPPPPESPPTPIKDESQDLRSTLRPPTPPKRTVSQPFFSTTASIGKAMNQNRTAAPDLKEKLEQSRPITLGKRKQPMDEEPPAKEKAAKNSDVPAPRPKASTSSMQPPKYYYMKGSSVPMRLQNVDGTDITDAAGPSDRTKRRKGVDGEDIVTSAKRPGASTSLTSKYEVNPARNNGKNFAYHETVRGNERKKLEAEDCDCCRDYYLAVGPLPPRAKAPLWRSPTSSPPPAHRCRKHGGGGSHQTSNDDEDEEEEQQIAAHRQAISRHRHTWERATTPPDYWKIGFPTTQEVADINERAEEIHEKRQRVMEKEAAKPDGKYRRK